MSEPRQRMTESESPPTTKQIEAWLGKKAYAFWQHVAKMIEAKYPGVFAPEWLYGGKNHGWSLRYKKSRAFCTLVPEKGLCRLLIVFGAEERAKVETLRKELSPQVQEAYDAATTYHDGKWLLLNIDNKTVVADTETLLAVKRKPKMAKS